MIALVAGPSPRPLSPWHAAQPADRHSSGALVGAGAGGAVVLGAVVGAGAGGAVVLGAVVGAGAGGAVGAGACDPPALIGGRGGVGAIRFVVGAAGRANVLGEYAWRTSISSAAS